MVVHKKITVLSKQQRLLGRLIMNEKTLDEVGTYYDG
jgi:hypothetical protein